MHAHLCQIPLQKQWFDHIPSAQTRRAYESDLRAFMAFLLIDQPDAVRSITREQVLAWRDALYRQGLAGATVRRKLAALNTLYLRLLHLNAVEHNPVSGVDRPRERAGEGGMKNKTPTLSDTQAQALLEAPPEGTVKGERDRAILSVLLYHALRREELTQLRVKDFVAAAQRGGQLQVHGRGGKVRSLPLHPHAARQVAKYLTMAGHGVDLEGPLFRRARPLRSQAPAKPLTAGAVYTEVVLPSLRKIGIEGTNMGPHALRATAANNALKHDADLASVQAWMGHATIKSTQAYDPRSIESDESPTFRVAY